jgi:hypothetical protein
MIGHYVGHQRWQILFWVCLQTACVGALSTTSVDNPTKSIFLVMTVAVTVAPAQLMTIVMLCFGLENQMDMYVFPILPNPTEQAANIEQRRRSRNRRYHSSSIRRTCDRNFQQRPQQQICLRSPWRSHIRRHPSQLSSRRPQEAHRGCKIGFCKGIRCCP